MEPDGMIGFLQVLVACQKKVAVTVKRVTFS